MAERTGRWLAATLVLVPVTGCAAPVAPLPVRPPTASPATPAATTVAPTPPGPVPGSVGATPSRPAPPPSTPERTPGTRPPSASPRPSACLGPVRYDLVLADTELALVRSLCLSVGGVLRLQGIGPGEVTVDREDLVDQNYEAAVVDLRFLRPGTVGVTIPYDGRTYLVTVVVV
ncbi:hypothetical protein [Micromonospora sp. HUAS LYJ1]|uniref:hypothetical protein n=1 Tax=Micromonospora sp. HUAS LYJ1 TaxID=3061626 RepID=UPI0026732B74|nr:hypothetical protein [Micromonospora sp. HUAS LYJ1]WKU05199.1 hypothetical protein Q2K16_31355 [Micromonospora sp. HUAS LYJ1]